LSRGGPYIHGTASAEQKRLAALNQLTNAPFLNFLDIRTTDRVLEVGSGLGILASEAAQQAPQGYVVGVEYAPAQISCTRVERPNLRFLRGDAHFLPFTDNHFDVVYCRYLLEHVRDPLQVLYEKRRVLKSGGRAFAQENNMRMVVFDPDCPHFDALLPKFCELQDLLGGDALIGKRLFALFRAAGFRNIELSYQPEIHVAGNPTFQPWIDNFIGLLEGASGLLVAHHLATTAEIEAVAVELRLLRSRDDASGLFHWNRATGVK